MLKSEGAQLKVDNMFVRENRLEEVEVKEKEGEIRFRRKCERGRAGSKRKK